MLGKLDLFAVASARQAHALQRNAVLTQNIAHADTPGFRAQDVAPFRMPEAGAVDAVPRATRPGHVQATASGLGRASVGLREMETHERTPDGNTVDLEQQMVAANQTRATFDLAAGLYARHLAMLRMVVGRGGQG